MTKEIVRTKTSKNAETLMAVYIYIYISIHLQTSGIRLLDHTHILYRNVQFAMQKLQCLNTFIQVAILLKKRENKKAKSVFKKICFINSVKEKKDGLCTNIKIGM